MKKILLLIVCVLGLITTNVYAVNGKEKDEQILTTTAPTATDEAKVTVYIFTKDGCPYCEAAKEYLNSLKKDKKIGKYFQIKEYLVWNADWSQNEDAARLMNAVGESLGVTVNGAPYIVIGDSFNKNGYTEEWNDEFKQAIIDEYNNEAYVDLVDYTSNNMPEIVQSNDTWIVVGLLVVVAGAIVAFTLFSKKNN